ncbi:MAG: hypothetical protein WBB25_10800 [Sulfitobacter sp.]
MRATATSTDGNVGVIPVRAGFGFDEDALARWMTQHVAFSARGQARKLLHDSAGFTSQIDRALISIATAGNGTEGHEGIDAFLTKRKPDLSSAV